MTADDASCLQQTRARGDKQDRRLYLVLVVAEQAGERWGGGRRWNQDTGGCWQAQGRPRRALAPNPIRTPAASQIARFRKLAAAPNIPTPPPTVTADSSNALSPQTRHPASSLCMSSTRRESKPLFPPPHSVNAARSRMSHHRTTSEDGRRTEVIDCPASDHNMNVIDGVPLGNVYPDSYSAVAQGVSFPPVGICRECSTFTCSHPCGR